MRNTFIALLAGAMGLLFADASLAYNIYNKAGNDYPYDIEAWGEHCPACFHGWVKPGSHKSCPGNETGCKHHTRITACILIMGGDVNGGNTLDLRNCSTKVPPHGWVEFVDARHSMLDGGPWDSLLCIVYDKDGKKLNVGPMEKAYEYNSCNVDAERHH